MQNAKERSAAQALEHPQRCNEQNSDADDACQNAVLSCEGKLEISADDNFGTDPYNKTGRFTKLKD
jgi:hypothetical protein